ncbi:hypothetical protein BDR06DRAFT_1043103 [Suillus hirtellus]|nr:hypothetical protein BDR06DRAFT_1043103 [Suillus hirtellus]
MCFSSYKRAAETDLTPTKPSKKMRVALESAERRSNRNALNIDSSAAEERTMKDLAYALLEALERMEYNAENMEEEMCRNREEVDEIRARHLDEMDEMRIVHDAALQQHQDYIDELEEDVRYKQAMIDFLTEDVERLEEDTDRQRKDIDRFIKESHQEDIARRESVSALKDTIIALFDNANPDALN